jgi:hypothetical protein
MIKNISQLEITINEKVIRLLADMDTNIYIVREALNQFQKYVDAVEEAAKTVKVEKE